MTRSPETTTDRLARLEDEAAILDTLYRYGHTLDHGPQSDWVDCFTDDATWTTRRHRHLLAGAAEHNVQGRAALAELVAGFPHPPEAYHKHMLVEPRIDLEGDRCQATSYFLAVSAHVTGPYILAFGRYRDRLVRCPDGRWRFEERVAEIDGTHPLREPNVGPDVSQSLAIEDIKRLKARYCRYVDTQQWGELAELFTEGAQLYLDAADNRKAVDGRTAIVALVSDLLEKRSTVHEASMPVIELTGESTAKGSWSMFSIVKDDTNGSAEESQHTWGYHDDTYELGSDGRWRIQSLRVSRLHAERR
jgi:hypothetical protein